MLTKLFPNFHFDQFSFKSQFLTMKLLILILSAINAEFLKKEESTQFLAKANRSDCGDMCSHRKDSVRFISLF